MRKETELKIHDMAYKSALKFDNEASVLINKIKQNYTHFR
jgi:hypothetical protein